MLAFLPVAYSAYIAFVNGLQASIAMTLEAVLRATPAAETAPTLGALLRGRLQEGQWRIRQPEIAAAEEASK